jgi:hypothetical protein
MGMVFAVVSTASDKTAAGSDAIDTGTRMTFAIGSGMIAAAFAIATGGRMCAKAASRAKQLDS